MLRFDNEMLAARAFSSDRQGCAVMYAVFFSTNIAKVGQTSDPNQRFVAIVKEANAVGECIGVIINPSMPQPEMLERKLIETLSPLNAFHQWSREWFSCNRTLRSKLEAAFASDFSQASLEDLAKFAIAPDFSPADPTKKLKYKTFGLRADADVLEMLQKAVDANFDINMNKILNKCCRIALSEKFGERPHEMSKSK